MRSHTQIVSDAGKPEDIALRRGVSAITVRSWARRDSIPAEHWAGFVNEGATTFEELSEALAQKKTAA